MEQEELTKLRENTQDKDYIKFLMDEGWKCGDETDALVRYSRLRKSKEGKPLTLDEFSAELETNPTGVAVQQLYSTLLALVGKGALTTFDLYQYAKFRWCRNHPEAVVAYQTGPHSWAVNTCDTRSTRRSAQSC